MKLTLVKNNLNLSMKYWFMDANIDFCICLGHGKGSKYHLETVETIFIESNDYYRTIQGVPGYEFPHEFWAPRESC